MQVLPESSSLPLPRGRLAVQDRSGPLHQSVESLPVPHCAPCSPADHCIEKCRGHQRVIKKSLADQRTSVSTAGEDVQFVAKVKSVGLPSLCPEAGCSQVQSEVSFPALALSLRWFVSHQFTKSVMTVLQYCSAPSNDFRVV